MAKFINKLKYIFSFASQRKWPRPRFRPFDFRLSTFGLLLTFNFSLLISSCGLDVEDPTPPSPPVWVEKSLPEEWPERGIDAHESGGIYLEWESNPEDNINTYLIYRAEYFETQDSIGDYEFLSQLKNDLYPDLNFIDHLIKRSTRYYYKLKTEDSAGNLSNFSDSTSYTLLPTLSTDTMIPNGTSDPLKNSRSLTWIYPVGFEMENYCLTMITQNYDLVFRTLIDPTDYVNGQESWRIPDSVVLGFNEIYKWRIDIGAQYVNNRETKGAESGWATMMYLGF